jgi:hypothetical protein
MIMLASKSIIKRTKTLLVYNVVRLKCLVLTVLMNFYLTAGNKKRVAISLGSTFYIFERLGRAVHILYIDRR